MRVAMLGPLEVHDDGGVVVPVAGTRLRSLLIRLALDAGRTVTADALAHALWSDDQPADPVNALQSLVSRLRRTLGGPPELHSEPGGYRLDLARGAVDVLAFEDLVADGRHLLAGGDAERAVRRLRKALALWRGSALTDAADAPFASGVTVRLDELRATATEECVAAELAAASPPGPLVGELRELVARHPLRERARGLLLRALHADGRQAEALRAYDDYRRMLADELGADPGPELQSIHLAVLRGEGGPAPAPAQRSRGNLRAPLTSFVGRDAERTLIAEQLDEGHRLITLAGPGGAGKTRLATAFAAGIAGDVPDGVWLIELAPITPTDDVARAVAGALGLHAEVPAERSIPARDTTTRLVEALSATETLLVLDNCEHVVDAVARLVDDLLGRCPRLKVLATSREPLGILGEALCHVPPLPVPPPRTGPGEAITFPAVRLFADRTAAVQAGFAVTEDNVGAVVDICRRLDGLPLAIELAAARLRSLTLAQVAAGLDDRFDLLIGGIRTAVPRHRTLRAVIAWSWDLLDDDERRLAERLAVFSGTFTADSAAHMCTVSPPVSRPAREALSGLVDKSLVRISDAPQARYRMLESIREYGMQRLAEAGAAGTLRAAHAAHFLDLAERAQAHVVAGDQLPWIHRLRAEHDNLLAALHWAHDVGDADTAVRLGAALSLFWTVRGSHVDAANWLGLALDVPGDAPEAARTIAASVYLFNAALASGDVDAGTVELIRARLDHAGPVSSSGDLALIEAAVGLVDEDTAARVLATDGRPAHPDPWKRGVQRLTYAMLLGNGGDMEAMADELSASVAAFREAGERWGLATSLTYLAMARKILGDAEGAIAGLEASIDLLRELDPDDDAVMQRVWIADARRQRGERAPARADLLALTESGATMRSGPWRGVARISLGNLARDDGDLPEAARQYDAAAEELRDSGTDAQLYGALLAAARGHLAVACGAPATARRHLGDAFAAAVASPDLPLVAMVAVAIARLALHEGSAAAAAEVLGAAHALRGGADALDPDVAALVRDLRDALDAPDYEAAYAWGCALGREEALAAIETRLRSGQARSDVSGGVSPT